MSFDDTPNTGIIASEIPKSKLNINFDGQGKESVSSFMLNLSIEDKEEVKIMEEPNDSLKEPEKRMEEYESSGENKEKKIELQECFLDLDDFDDILHRLNMEGEKHGVMFKKGTIQYWEDKSVKYKGIICSCISRNHGANKKLKKQENKRSLENPGEQQKESCKASYRFKYEKGSGKFLGLVSNYEIHSNHEFKVKKNELTADMIKEISYFNKMSAVLQIKEFIEMKFKVELSYQSVYREFRKTFPLLGPDDATNFINWCKEYGFTVYEYLDETNRHYTKLFISSQLMQTHFKAYGDVVLVDSTYRVNKYKLPIVIFSGFTHSGRNCLFGFGIVNDETENTYRWLFSNFFKTHNSRCSIIVTDHDPAMEAVLNKDYPSITHLLCQWHIIQSFNKNFSYLGSLNYGDLKKKIMSLPFEENRLEFEKIYAQVIKELEEKKYEKSISYLKKMFEIKAKWAQAFVPPKFTGGVHSTSRAESMNALLKKYVNSKNEISDVIIFLKNFEKKLIDNESKPLKVASDQYENHPLANDLKKKVHGVVYEKHFSQLALSHNYYCKFEKTLKGISYYEVKNIQINTQKSRQVKIIQGKYECECSTYVNHGLICRHVFSLAIMFQDKTLENIRIHKRWEIPFCSGFQLQNENYEFETQQISNYLKIFNKNEESLKSEEKKEESKTQEQEKKNFVTKIKGKGAPKKEERKKSYVEKISVKKKKTIGKSILYEK